MQMVYELADRLNVDPHWLATGEDASTRWDDYRTQLRAAQNRIRNLEARLAAIGALVTD